VLELSMNNLSSLPPAVGALASLATLDLSDNRLASLPDDLGALASLQSLGLRSNSLGELCEGVGALGALTSLDVSMNHLEALPWSVTRMTALQQVRAARRSVRPRVGVCKCVCMRVQLWCAADCAGDQSRAGSVAGIIRLWT
jgi:Leucine-rich repeat (LRR) protein